jgi:hypothetical protein
VHAQVVTSARGSTFFLCKLSFVDSRFAKYPVLPVRQCSGYRANEVDGGNGITQRRSETEK